jgi:cytochrome c5
MSPKRFLFYLALVFVQQILFMDGAMANDIGRAVYKSICMACHAPQNVMVSSPKAGDVGEWNRRLAKGLEATTDNAVNGFGAMPPKGGSGELARDQIRSAIQYMAAPAQ